MMAPQKFMGADCDPVALPKRLPTWRPVEVEWQRPRLRAGLRALVSYYQPYLIIVGCAFVGAFAMLLLVAVAS